MTAKGENDSDDPEHSEEDEDGAVYLLFVRGIFMDLFTSDADGAASRIPLPFKCGTHNVVSISLRRGVTSETVRKEIRTLGANGP
jgi:hypothetical protein